MKDTLYFELNLNKLHLILVSISFILLMGGIGFVVASISHENIFTNTVRAYSESQVNIGSSLTVVGTGSGDSFKTYAYVDGSWVIYNLHGTDSGSNPYGDGEEGDSGMINCPNGYFVSSLKLNDKGSDEYEFWIDCDAL